MAIITKSTTISGVSGSQAITREMGVSIVKVIKICLSPTVTRMHEKKHIPKKSTPK